MELYANESEFAFQPFLNRHSTVKTPACRFHKNEASESKSVARSKLSLFLARSHCFPRKTQQVKNLVQGSGIDLGSRQARAPSSDAII